MQFLKTNPRTISNYLIFAFRKNTRWPLAYKTSVLVGLLAFTLMLVSPKL